jgi:hypothetical protein
VSPFLKAKRGFVFFRFSTRPYCSFHNRASSLRRASHQDDQIETQPLHVPSSDASLDRRLGFRDTELQRKLSSFHQDDPTRSNEETSLFWYSMPLSVLSLTGFLPVRKNVPSADAVYCPLLERSGNVCTNLEKTSMASMKYAYP